MSVISLPTGFRPSSVSLRLYTNQRVNAAPFGGSEQAVDLLNDRWLMSLRLPASLPADAAAREAFLAALRGQVNTCALWHFARPVPRGTARGTLLINGAAAQGASSIAIDGISPGTGTLLAGDLLGAGGQLLMVAADVTASGGAATVTLVNRLRAAIADNAAVTWSQPTVPFRLVNTPSITYLPGLAEAVDLDFAEAVA
jgi:hypothetical protein